MKLKLLLFLTLLSPLALFAQEKAESAPLSEKAKIRKERNTLEVSTGVEGSLTNLNNAWIETSGGDNSVTTTASLFLKHKYVKNRFSVESSLSAKYGYYNVSVERANDNGTYSEGVWFKNQDEFSLSVAPAWAMSKNWSYGATMSFRSQFSNGYLSSSSQEDMHLKSGFLSPGYLNISVGVNYQCPKEKFPVKVTLSPLALSGIFVSKEEVRQNALYQYADHSNPDNWKYTDVYGVDPNKRSKFEGGSSVQIDFDRTWGKNNTFRYLTTLFSFYGWISNAATSNGYGKYEEYEEAVDEWSANGNIGDQPAYLVKPTVRWVNRFEIKATKYLYTNVDFELYYDRAQNSSLQTKTILSLGVSYKFTNK